MATSYQSSEASKQSSPRRNGAANISQESKLDDILEDSFRVSNSEDSIVSRAVGSSTGKSIPSPTTHVVISSESMLLQGLEEDVDRAPTFIDTATTSWCVECLKNFPMGYKAAYKHRKCPNSFRIFLIFFMFVLLGIVERGCFVVLFYMVINHSRFTPGESIVLDLTIKFFIYILYPVTGFLADTFYGHHRVIRVSLCIAWLGSAFMSLSLASYKQINDASCAPTAHCWSVPVLVTVGIGYMIYGIGLTGIRVNLIPFGADQLPDASGGELSSYFHWYYFSITLGHLIAVIFLPLLLKYTSIAFVFLAVTTVITIFLSIFVLFQYQWFILPKKGNPLKLVYNVVKDAFHSRGEPVKKTAFDIGKPKPSLIDRAMIKYGGVYRFEEVDAVKTFFRLLVIAMSCIGYYVVFTQLQTTAVMQGYRMTPMYYMIEPCQSKQQHQLKMLSNSTMFKCHSWKSLPTSLFGTANLFPLLFILPFYDRVIYLCLSGWKWFSMLSRIAIGNLFVLASIISAIVIEGIRMHKLQERIGGTEEVMINMISFSSHKDITLYEVASPLHVLYLAIPFLLFDFAELFSNITVIEFIYAQAPGNMKGMLIGILFAAEGIAMGISALVIIMVSFIPPFHFCSFFGNTREFFSQVLNVASECRKKHSDSFFGCTDGVLFVYVLFAIIAVISVAVFAVSAYKYKHRQRDRDPYLPIWLIPEDRQSTLQHIVRKCCC